MKVLVTGAQGQLGQELKQLANLHPEINFNFYTKSDWDITDSKKSHSILCNSKADFIINTAAYTKVDQAEINPEICNKINFEAPKVLAAQCNELNVKFIQISSDYVFSNTKHIPLAETFPKNPKGIYAISKSMAEDSIMNTSPHNIIIRTSWLYSTFGHNFVKTMILLAKSGKEIHVVNDQIGSPTYAADLARLIVDCILSPVNKFEGIYHYSNEGMCSWFDFAAEIFNYLKIEASLKPISTQDFGALAPRPAFSQLDCSKIKNEMHCEIPNWKTSLHKCLDNLKKTF